MYSINNKLIKFIVYVIIFDRKHIECIMYDLKGFLIKMLQY